MILSEAQQAFVQEAINGKDSLILLGEAGAGKSVAIRALIDELIKARKVFLIAAPTGVAALNVGGCTIHSYLNFLRRNPIGRVDLILVDEVSMVRADLLDAFDKALRSSKRINLPFGGVRVVLVGDPLQLPPVVTKDEAKEIREKYPSEYFFSAEVFAEVPWKIIELTQIFRQTDETYLKLLHDIRRGDVGDWVTYLNDNRRVVQGASAKGVVLTPKNDAASQINHRKLQQIESKDFKFSAVYGGKFYEREFPTDVVLHLRKGARVMCVKNLYTKAEGLVLANGDMGTVVDVDDKAVVFKSDRTGDDITIVSVKWSKMEKVTNDDGEIEDEEVGFFAQMPLRLGWAVTIHKSQGATLDELTIDLRSPLFARGQAYVALSRGRSLEKLWLFGKMRNTDVMVCPKILDFLKNKLESKYVKNTFEKEIDWIDEMAL